MKVHLIKRQSIEDYVNINARSKSSFQIWLSIIKTADWNIPADIIKTFGYADILGKGTNRVVFNVGGNTYRIICKYAFGQNMAHLFVCWIGIHTEYDELCNRGEQYTVNLY